MDESKIPPFLKSERDRTNQSLFIERDRTNRSLEKTRDEVEISTDENLRNARNQANREQSVLRSDSDTKHRLANQNRQSFEPNDLSNDTRLFEERERADQATKKERAQTDVAILRERELKSSLVDNLVGKERAQTDLHLGEERTHTDSEVKRVTNLLSDEVTTHARTKLALTTRDEFLAIVSHDLRNPIGAISSCAEMLLEDSIYSGIDPETKHWIEFMKRNANVALSLIGDILDMERIAEGKLALRVEENLISQVIRESVENFVHLASAKNILLRSKVNNSFGNSFFDRGRIRQVLGNLIGNAIKFTPDGGTVVLDAEIKDGNVLVSVSDSGPGIPSEKQNTIFERFAQIGLKDRRGLGLGLYISKMLIEAHQGKIWVESEPGKGSTFWFAIPRQSPSGKSDLH